MMSALQNENDRRVAEQASEWVTRLAQGTLEDHEAFAKWVTESRRNVEEFLLASAVEKALDNMDPQRQFDVSALWRAAAKNVVSIDTPLKTLAQTPGTRTRRYMAWAATFAVLSLITAWISWQQPALFGGWERYSTAVGEQRALHLPDGSLVELNTHSRLEVRLTATARDLRLIEGEALFQVRHDSARPFRVNAGSALVQALGTQFNIYRHGDIATVAVIEGRVRVASPSKERPPAELSAGQQLHVARGGPIIKEAAPDVQRAIAWRQRRLMFHKDTLADIAQEFNRYNREPQIRVEGEAVRAKRYTGIFDADDPGSLIEYLARDPTLAFEKRTNEILVKPRA